MKGAKATRATGTSTRWILLEPSKGGPGSTAAKPATGVAEVEWVVSKRSTGSPLYRVRVF